MGSHQTYILCAEFVANRRARRANRNVNGRLIVLIYFKPKVLRQQLCHLCYVAPVRARAPVASTSFTNIVRLLSVLPFAADVVTGDPRYYHRAQWGRLVAGEDVVAILGNAYDTPLLPKAHVRNEKGLATLPAA